MVVRKPRRVVRSTEREDGGPRVLSETGGRQLWGPKPQRSQL